MATTFNRFMAELKREAKAEGPVAVAELKSFEDRFRLARRLAARRRKRRLSGYDRGTSRHVRAGTIASKCRTFGVTTDGPSARAWAAIRTSPSNAVGAAVTTPPRRRVAHSFAAARQVDVAIGT